MAKQADFDLEGQKNEDTNIRPLDPHGEQPVTDIRDKSDPNGNADEEKRRKERIPLLLERFISDPYGSPEYYEHLVKLSLTDTQLGSHGLLF
jgi:hypothetical protein